MGSSAVALPAGIVVLERGWLSANNVLLKGQRTALVDSGYATHADQTVALVDQALGGRALDALLNTHLHSDHCGGNAALQARHPGVETFIPPGQAELVRHWDPVGLSYAPTGQLCPAFRFEGVLQPGMEVLLGSDTWEVHAAPGHDPHSVVLFQPGHRLLMSADALWERGFGIVFPELDGVDAFDEVAATLDLIERLAPTTIIPGHGRVFTDVAGALAYARQRLDGFARDPRRHALHAAKVLLKFKLLELQRVPQIDLLNWASQTSHLASIHANHFTTATPRDWVEQVARDLVASGAAAMDGDDFVNA